MRDVEVRTGRNATPADGIEEEHVILNDPVDLGMDIVEGEERHLNLGATVKGRVLLVVTTWREDRVQNGQETTAL